jgi:hypothetical protein
LTKIKLLFTFSHPSCLSIRRLLSNPSQKLAAGSIPGAWEHTQHCVRKNLNPTIFKLRHLHCTPLQSRNSTPHLFRSSPTSPSRHHQPHHYISLAIRLLLLILIQRSFIFPIYWLVNSIARVLVKNMNLGFFLKQLFICLLMLLLI